MGILSRLSKKADTPKDQFPEGFSPFDDEPEFENPFNATRTPSNASAKQEQPDSSAEDVQQEHFDPELAAANIKLKRKLNLPSFSALFGEHYSLLAFQAGSFGLRGALVKNSKNKAVIAHVAESRTVDFTRAIAEILIELKRTSKRLPKRAILLTPSVISAQINLPVSPLRPREDEEMQDLIRWELEGAVTQQNKHWMIGSMLIERGYLTPEQRDEVLDELQIRQAQGGPQSLVRFGDLAVQLNFINRDQLEECFTLQGKLVAVDDDLVYGWQASELERDGPSDEILLSREDDSDSSHPWLVCGMSKTVRRRWIGAFNLNGIHIEAFYSSLGSAFANLWHYCDQEHQALLEVHQEQLAFISGTPNTINEIAIAERAPGPVSLDACLDLIGTVPEGVQRLYLTSNCNAHLKGLMQDLVDALDIDVQLFSAPAGDMPLPGGVHKDALLGIQGAVNHYLKHIPDARLTWINARESQEPAWKKLTKPKNIGIAAGVVLFCAASGFMGWMHWNTDVQTQRLAELERKFDSEMKVKKRLQSLYQENLQLKASIADIAREIELTQALSARVQRNRSYRVGSTAPLLKAITLGVTMDIALTNIEKQADRYQVKAIASDNNAAREYVNTLGRFIKPLNYQVVDSGEFEDQEHGFQTIVIDLDYQPDLALELITSLQNGEP
ncbi:hypothetical protein [Neptunomonas sp. XY-337]|uniref:hypothetical protein n=1 Tax=Neptunomonas sp. XY-337 TaxID=2561897 RepID=UPI0010A9A5F6|nr:hypothetical protein [Neptunomonas sp. XY-337]